jgi:AcrR family transcriptional regulator
MALYSEQGFDQTTVEEIAQRAGVTRRTFFRHFADKREVLFGSGQADGLMVKAALQSASEDASPLDVVGMALVALAAKLDGEGEAAVRRIRIVRASPELWERQLIKFTALAEALAVALRGKGVPDPTAILAAESGITALRVASDAWIADPKSGSLRSRVVETLAALRSVASPSISPAS